MAATRANLKWNRPSSSGKDALTKGVKPLPDPMTLPQLMVDLVMHICRRILLRETIWRLAIYGGLVLCGSLIADFAPIPKSYLSQKTNIFNVYFVKIGWAWTIGVAGTFIAMTSSVYCCGDIRRVLGHLARLLVATLCWVSCTSIFQYVEAATGYCVAADVAASLTIGRDACVSRGLRWHGFDISGHTFILVYGSLVMSEEAKSIRGWARIADMIRNKDFDDDSPLLSLSTVQQSRLETLYTALGSYVKVVFVAMTALSVLWDLMLLSTVMYFHTAPQKVAGALFAFAAWMVTYRGLFPNNPVIGMPGHGLFKYHADDWPVAARASSLYTRRTLSEARQMRRQQNGSFEAQGS